MNVQHLSAISPRLRVCILTPGHLSTNPRVVKEADALAEAGYEVSVIAADFVRWARKADQTLLTRKWSVADTIPFGPDAPGPARLLQLFRQRLASVLVALGIRTPPVVRAAWHPIGPDLLAAAKRVPADLYIAHYVAALPAAAIAARYHGALYAFDAEDYHVGDFPEFAKRTGKLGLVRSIETHYLGGCSYVTASSPGIADAYEKTYKIKRPTVILNVFPRAQAPHESTPAGTSSPRPSVYWFSQTIGPNRGLECAVRAISLARSQPHLYLRGTPARGFVQSLTTMAAVLGVAHRVHILPPEPPAEMERLAAIYDIGLVGETDYLPSRRIALTNKLFTYFLAGVPVAMSDVAAHRELACEVGIAAQLYATDNADSLASALDKFLDDPAMLAAGRATAFHLGQSRYNWETEHLALLDCIKTAFGDCSRRRGLRGVVT